MFRKLQFHVDNYIYIYIYIYISGTTLVTKRQSSCAQRSVLMLTDVVVDTGAYPHFHQTTVLPHHVYVVLRIRLVAVVQQFEGEHTLFLE